ncbi:MAG: hypothetical protein A3G59_03225 [Candidatus Taylorbacteria bacterium RIFCSPLOWO2_12_FULL_47_20]|uniref:Uncharacterized protein n=2 Tax=Candidatus Tayloriibacteriota TaxID=1817919 RepID=A0A1G2PB98_9BACT|nr:MAG: hypothetical protein A3H68_03595 [Candidatus Taylorbacteria bacterium RIFCSPLOWO2_02_FULL_46_40]OHA45598.1 MAG: hypothetical protein A3G59_03225 [Candidatus Taylorbacteria bacterium RIFCSPLOWO2_12_FULL_47_20]
MQNRLQNFVLFVMLFAALSLFVRHCRGMFRFASISEKIRLGLKKKAVGIRIFLRLPVLSNELIVIDDRLIRVYATLNTFHRRILEFRKRIEENNQTFTERRKSGPACYALEDNLRLAELHNKEVLLYNQLMQASGQQFSQSHMVPYGRKALPPRLTSVGLKRVRRI